MNTALSLGTSLSRMAAKLPGGNTKANQEAIVKLNPSLQASPDRIVYVGRVYILPAGGAPSPAPAAPATVTPTPAPAPAPTPAPPAPAPAPAVKPAAGESLYTVKKSDTLWGIARDQLGDPGQVAAIKELNKDMLKGSDLVREGQKLRLPAKPPVASAR